MNIKKIILTCAVAMGCLAVSAQKIAFDKTTVTTKTALWKHPVTAVFRFTNKGKAPLFIKNVDAGCGCLTPKWTQGAIEKGEQGEIVITYDAKMLGKFDRYIEVFTNEEDSPISVRMKGIVTAGEAKTVNDIYPYSIDDIHLSTSSIEFAEVSKGDSTTTSIEVYNGGKDVYTPTLMHLPPYITAKAEPEMLARGRKGTIQLTLHGDKLNDLGLNQTNIYLARFAGDKVGTNNELNVSAILLPDLTQENMQARKPKFEISTNELYLGAIGKKKKLKGTVKITNTGDARLKIDRIQAFNPAIMVSMPQTDIFPGESVKMTFTVQAKYLELSKAQPRVLLITNDPNHPKEVVSIIFE